MGEPKKLRKKYKTPSHPFDGERIKAENKLMEAYGFKNKKEIWKMRSRISNYRRQARTLLGHETHYKKARGKELIDTLHKLGLLSTDKNTLDDVLSLKIEDILERRLQTLVYKKGLAVTPKQARQFITHGNIAVNGQRTRSPGRIISTVEEPSISYYGKQPELKFGKVTSTTDELEVEVGADKLSSVSAPKEIKEELKGEVKLEPATEEEDAA